MVRELDVNRPRVPVKAATSAPPSRGRAGRAPCGAPAGQPAGEQHRQAHDYRLVEAVEHCRCAARTPQLGDRPLLDPAALHEVAPKPIGRRITSVIAPA